MTAEAGAAGAVWEGVVWHHRRSPAVHRFQNRIWLAELDLDRLDETLAASRVLSGRPRRPLRFRRSDYLGDPQVPLAEAVRDVVEERLGERPRGAIRMVGQLRSYGWLFNPIVFYFCHREDGSLGWIVGNVTNTPWKERHSYVFEAAGTGVSGHLEAKAMHVSPFMPMDQQYRFEIDRADDRMRIRIENLQDGEKVFDAGLSLHRRPLHDRNLARMLVRYPLLTMRVSASIHRHALALWLKGVPFRQHPGRRASMAQRAARSVVRLLGSRLRSGEVTLHDALGESRLGGGAGDRSATVEVGDLDVYREVLRHGSIGLGGSYIDGRWDCDDLTGLLGIIASDLWRLDPLRNRLDRLAAPIAEPLARLRREDKARDRLDVAAHYDLGNEFFATFLDETMSYSCALFESDGTSLADASRAKFERICRRLRLGPADHLVEIGTGWGGFALHAATNHGCRVTTTTISAEQEVYARARVQAAGLGNLVTVLGEDYRDLRGSYDALVSIEMIEAVDWREYERFMGTCGRLLHGSGRMALQAIVIPDHRFERAKNSDDFIKRYVFPGGCLPSVSAILDAGAAASDLSLVGLDDIGTQYVRTLARWRANFDAAASELDALGVDEAFRRLWRFYLAYCEAGFSERHISAVQAFFAKPRWQPA